jgi:hypothetical protein
MGSILLVLLFQNCQKADKVVDLGATGTALSSNAIPGATNAYNPIRMDQVCNDADSVKQTIINTYIRLMHRCADRPGLDFWYHAQIRNGGDLSGLEAGIKASAEYKNQNLFGQGTSDRFCLSGDTFQMSANGVVQTSAQLDAVGNADQRTWTISCKTGFSQNLTASAGKVVKDSISPSFDSGGGSVCSVPGDNLRNHIIELYIAYLDRCPDLQGLNWWAQNWAGDSAFTNSSDVQKYLTCRYPNGSMSSAPQATIDTCYKQLSGVTMCPTGNFVKTRFCEITGL